MRSCSCVSVYSIWILDETEIQHAGDHFLILLTPGHMVEGFRLLDLLTVLLCGCHCDASVVRTVAGRKTSSIEDIYILAANEASTLRCTCHGAEPWRFLGSGVDCDQLGSISHFSVPSLRTSNCTTNAALFWWSTCTIKTAARLLANRMGSRCNTAFSLRRFKFLEG